MAAALLLLGFGANPNADAGVFGLGGDSWKEEVLLHDGQKIIVERSQSYGGFSEPGQGAPVKEHRLVFTPPGSKKSITWTSGYGEELGRTNFNLLAVHVLDGTPYLVVEPNLCLSYGKWGRPNPPYVFFKYEGSEWKRIDLDAFPAAFKTVNVVINESRQRDIKRLQNEAGYVPAEGVREINNSLRDPEYQSILRAELPPSALCPDWSSPKYRSPKAPLPIGSSPDK